MSKKFNLVTAQSTTGFIREQIYNSLDTIATLEIDQVLDAKMTDSDRRTFNFLMAIQTVAMDMTIRGIRINEFKRDRLREDLTKELRRLERALANHPTIKPIWDHMEKNTGACAMPSRKDGKHKWQLGVEDGPDRRCLDCGASRMRVRPFQPGSDDDVKHLVYGLWKLKTITNKDGKVTADKEARERLRDRLKPKEKQYEEPLTLLDQFADTQKQIGFLKFRSDDGRFHASFNVGVTSTHRWSSNQDAYGRGSNAQNITEKHRHIFEADEGYELWYADLKQAESKVISYVAGDEEYMAAHEGGDTHTYVCRLVWPEGINGVPWTGDLAKDKKIATSAAPPWDNRPGHDYRYQSKAVQHGSNLGLTPYGMAIQKRIPVEAAKEGQGRYFRAFPGIRDYQSMIRSKVQNMEPIITPLGIRFKLFGRPWDEHTYKEGLAVIPQSMVGYIVSIGAYRIFMELPEVQLLAQVHDALVFQTPIGRRDLGHKALQLMRVPVPVTDVRGKTRTLTIEVEGAIGKNWGHGNREPFDREGKPKFLNPDGIHEIIFADDGTYVIKD